MLEFGKFRFGSSRIKQQFELGGFAASLVKFVELVQVPTRFNLVSASIRARLLRNERHDFKNFWSPPSSNFRVYFVASNFFLQPTYLLRRSEHCPPI